MALMTGIFGKFLRSPITLGRYVRDKMLAPFAFRMRVEHCGDKLVLRGFAKLMIKPRGRVVIGSGVRLCSSMGSNVFCLSRPVSFFCAPDAEIVIGDNVGASGVAFVAFRKIEIGARTIIGAESAICDSDCHPLSPYSRRKDMCRGAISRPITIGHDVFIGARSMILKGVTVGNGAVIGAGSVVTHDVKPLEIVAGNPARKVGVVKVDV